MGSPPHHGPAAPPLWLQLQVAARVVQGVRQGRSLSTQLSRVEPALRPGAQALSFHALRWLGLAEALRGQLARRAPPPAADALLCTSLALIEGAEGQARRQQLQALQARLRAGVQALMARRPDLGWRLADSDTPVQPLIVGDNAAVMALAARLDAAGLRVPGIRPPTVPEGEARLRITLCASHTEADVDALLHALQNTLTSDLETATP